MRLRCHFLLFPKYHTRWLVSGLKLDKSHQSSGFQHAVWHKVKLRGLQVFIVPREGKVQRAFNCSHTEYIYLLTVIKCDMRKNADTSEVGLFLGFSAFFGELPRSFSVHICVWIICERLFWILCFVWGKGNIFNVSTHHCRCFFLLYLPVITHNHFPTLLITSSQTCRPQRKLQPAPITDYL